ncbi:hypothetical protein VTN49DRAFT_1851 [Thermomyces lanuginosus]|uniref:uncharacterized protein n=1 Tax=Thermomyces lanuginosus TaxID=5541 RepID=UPI0037422135
MDVPFNVQVNPNEDTEWNDILRKHGILPEKPPSPTPLIEEAILEARRKAHENRLEDKDLDELDELEDEEDEEFLAQYRKKRLAELATIQKTSIYNQVYPLQKTDYAREVTEASHKSFVLVNLFSPSGGNVESRVLNNIWQQLATKFGDIKFCQIRADLCIEGYPERNTPTILVYKDGEIRRQFVTLRELNGVRTKIEDLEKVLVDLGAVKENDVRLKKKDDQSEDERQNSHAKDDDDDSDWD